MSEIRERPEMPGGAQTPKIPFETEDHRFFDRLDPPKRSLNPDATITWTGGTELGKDEIDVIYATRYWERMKRAIPHGLKEAMTKNLTIAVDKGRFGCFTSLNGISERNKEELSAYRLLAKELGFEMGEYKFDGDSGATATLRRKETP